MCVKFPDFDVLLALYKHDPEALETFRRHMLREAVDYAPLEHRQSLERLLLHIEAVRDTATTPMEAATTAFRLMQESAAKLQGGWEKTLEAVAGVQAVLIIEGLRSNRQADAA